jgi:hypothetical protein
MAAGYDAKVPPDTVSMLLPKLSVAMAQYPATGHDTEPWGEPTGPAEDHEDPSEVKAAPALTAMQ